MTEKRENFKENDGRERKEGKLIKEKEKLLKPRDTEFDHDFIVMRTYRCEIIFPACLDVQMMKLLLQM